MTKEKKYLLVTIVASLLLSMLHCPLFENFCDDVKAFRYVGLLLSKGGIPYRDVFDHKPPLIYFLNYIGWFLGGEWAFWIIDTLLVLFVSIAFFRLCEKKAIHHSWILPVLFNLMIRDRLVSTGIGMTRAYTAIFILLFACVMLGNNKRKYMLLGILTALVFFMQQDQVLILLPFWIYVLTQNNTGVKSFFAKCVSLSLGFILVAALIISYFFYNHSLRFFWEDAFLFNFNWYNQHYPLTDNLKAIRNRLHETSYEIPFYIGVISGIASLLYGNQKKSLLVAALSAALLSFSAAIVSGKFEFGVGFHSYFLPFAATIPILLFVVFSGDTAAVFNNKMTVLLAAILYILPVFGLTQYTLHLPQKPLHFAEMPFEYQYISSKKPGDYELYIAFDANEIYMYNELRILSPSKWIYHYFWDWFDGWDADLKIMQSITSDLRKHKTKYIFDYSNGAFPFNDKRVYDYWQGFLKQYYKQEQIAQPMRNEGILWTLKENN